MWENEAAYKEILRLFSEWNQGRLNNEFGLEISDISDSQIAALSKLFPETRLHTIDISANRLSHEGTAALGSVLSNTTIRHIWATDCDWNTRIVNTLAQYLPGSGVEAIMLQGNPRADFTELFRILPNTNVKAINIVGNGMVESAFKSMIEMIPETKLTQAVFHDEYGHRRCRQSKEAIERAQTLIRQNSHHIARGGFTERHTKSHLGNEGPSIPR